MRKLLVALLCVGLLVGCGNGQSESKNEYSYSELEDLKEEFWDNYGNIIENLSSAELYGTSDDENEQNDHYFQVSSKYAKEISKEIDVPVGEKVVVTGYIDSISESDSDGFFTKKGVGKIFFRLKHKESDSEYDGFLCRTDNEDFLQLEPNTAITIEATLLDPELIGSDSDLYDCEIIEQ